jgi:hypothetical protein
LKRPREPEVIDQLRVWAVDFADEPTTQSGGLASEKKSK